MSASFPNESHIETFIPICLTQQQYDYNAIRVDNVFGNQIGHLPRKVVEKLAPYIVRPSPV